MKLTGRQILAAVLCALLLLFALLNLQQVRVHWIVATTTLPLIIVIAICAALGFAAGWMFSRRGHSH